jgi:glycosyltransferase involved in cell wall biosynthesis
MKVVISTPEYPPHTGGGLGQFYATLAPALARAGCDVSVVVAGAFSDGFGPYEHEGVRVEGVSRSVVDARVAEMAHLSAAPLYRRWIAAARAGHDAALALGPDVVETTDFGLHFVPFVLDPPVCPVIVQCHGSLGQIATHEPPQAHVALDVALSRFTEATLLPLADEVQTYGSPNAAEWTARLGRQVTVLPPPVPGGDLLPTEPPGPEGLVVARVQTWKGPGVLCEAMRRLPRAPRICWVGRDTETSPDGGSLSEYLAEEYPDVWGPRINPVGPVPPAEVRLLQRLARFVIVPSSWDVYNLTAAEAMRVGRVLVCSDGAGAADLIESGRNGWLFTAGHPASLAEALERAIEMSPADVARMGANAAETVAVQLNPETSARARLARVHEMIAAGLERQAVPDWIRDFCSARVPGRDGAFLDQVSLRDLTKYVGRRAGERLLSRAGFRPRSAS